MTTPQQLFSEHMNRIQTAISLGRPDRAPVVLFIDSFCVKHQNAKMSRFCTDAEYAVDTMINSVTSLGEIDGIEHVLLDPRLISAGSVCDVKLAGRDLPEGSLWQFSEVGKLTVEDYDAIIAQGWEAVSSEALETRMDDKNLLTDLVRTIEYIPIAAQRWIGKGIVPFTPVATNSPFDTVSFARGMASFYKDLYKHGDKIEEVVKIVAADITNAIRMQIRATHAPGVFIGLTRCAAQFMSRKFVERFAWPYTKALVEAVVAEGAFAYLHCDSNWERDLDLFLDLPKGRCVMSSDSATNIYKMKEKLGGHMCLMGDVPPSLLTLGTPDEVYARCVKNIREIGPAGYILSASCTVPTEAKPENVVALLAAAKDA